jgi:hypothetical protein
LEMREVRRRAVGREIREYRHHHGELMGANSLSKYDEIREAAVVGERLFRERHQRCLQYGTLLKHNFAAYCGIPQGQLRMLR